MSSRDTHHTFTSNRGFSLIEIMMAVVIIGLLAVFAVPSVMRSHARAQDKAILNNIRQLAMAAEQYCVVNSTSTVSISELVGPDKFIRDLKVLAGETYPADFKQGRSILVTGIGGNRSLAYDF